MLELVDVGPCSLSAYRGIAPDAVRDDLVRYAEDLRGARVLHGNATPYGAGVSELCRSPVGRREACSSELVSSSTARLITQVSRFDPWKDPLGVIAAYRLAREEYEPTSARTISSAVPRVFN